MENKDKHDLYQWYIEQINTLRRCFERRDKKFMFLSITSFILSIISLLTVAIVTLLTLPK